MIFKTRFWLQISLINLLVVAVLGVLMRYKIAYSFPHLDQKHLQHAHSHFAFIGWVAQTLFVLMIEKVVRYGRTGNVVLYERLLALNLFASYGMLVTFAFQGYSLFSISFSTLSVLVAYLLAYSLYKDLRELPGVVFKPWFNAALLFNVLSSVGTFALAFMMATKNFNTNFHLGALYFYLHFQYNGFFSFACIGLLLASIKVVMPVLLNNRLIFALFFYACFPAYLLSTLWANLPSWLVFIVVLAAIAQLLAWFLLLQQVRIAFKVSLDFLKNWRLIFYVIAVSVSVKLLLQLGSTIPAVSKLAFGFRPIVIAYLHLILLAIVSVFMVTYIYAQGLLMHSRKIEIALFAFVIMVYINEVLLGIQGIAALDYIGIPHVNDLLFIVALGISVAILALIGLTIKRRDLQEAKN